jgi:glycosyltransferase involved in cell wall biosynthesis
MKVLLVNSTCKVGGVSTFMLALRSALCARGHSCDLFFFEHGTMDAHLPAGWPVRFGSLADCLEQVARERYDVVHANNVDWPTGVSAVRRLGARLVVTAHKVREGAWTYGWNSTNCDAMTAVSRWIATALQPFTDLPVQVVYNGIDMARFRALTDADVRSASPGALARSPAAPIVAWIGRSGSPLKGLETFAAIAPLLHRGGLRIWVIDQHGPEKAEEVYPAASAALRPIAERWNSVGVDDMPALYRDIAESGGCVLATSVAEGLGLAVLEAQASGCLVVASDVRGHDESVSRAHGGLRFPLDTDPALVARLVLTTLADRPQVRARQAAAADYVRRRFSVEGMAREYEDVYDDRSIPAALSSGVRRHGRRRLSPLLHWSAYVTQRLGVGYAQLAASQRLLKAGHFEAASAAGLAALTTSPTMFIKPGRLVLLARVLRRHVVHHQHRLVVGRHDAAGVARVEDLH